MMILMAEEDRKKLRECRKWIVADVDKGFFLRNDAPEKIKNDLENIRKKYKWIDS